MEMPKPPHLRNAPPNDAPEPEGPKVTSHEADVIIKSTLHPIHRTDPNVLRFIENYMRCRDARQAAKEAGLTGASGRNLLGRSDIFACIEKLTAKATMKYGYDAAEVVEKVKEIASIDPMDIYDDNGDIKPMKMMAPEVRRAIKKFKTKIIYEKDPNGIEQPVGKIVEIEFWDKMRAAELLGREKDIFKEQKRVQHDVTSNMASVLLGSTRRAEERLESMRTAKAIATLMSPPVRDVTPAEGDG